METEALSVHEILQRYLTLQGVEEAEESLAILVVVHAQPIARRVITRRLHGAPPDQLEDVCNDALASLISRLRARCGTRSIGVSTDGLSKLIVGGAT